MPRLEFTAIALLLDLLDLLVASVGFWEHKPDDDDDDDEVDDDAVDDEVTFSGEAQMALARSSASSGASEERNSATCVKSRSAS
jgi:hypothetical protein